MFVQSSTIVCVLNSYTLLKCNLHMYSSINMSEQRIDHINNTVNAPDSVTVTPNMALKCFRRYHSLCEVAILSQYIAAAWHSSKVLHHVVQN